MARLAAGHQWSHTAEQLLLFEPSQAAALAHTTGARHCEIMKWLGHFPLSESSQQFRRYLLPVLDRITGQA